MTGALYSSGGYSGSPSPVPVGSYKQHTGVCGFPPPGRSRTSLPSVRRASTSRSSVRTPSSEGADLLRRRISVQNEDVWPWPGSVPVQLVEMLGGTQVGSVTCTISGGFGTTLTVDTNNTTGSGCTGTAPLTGFDTVEVEVPQAFTAVSVVGTSTFTLAPQVCGGGFDHVLRHGSGDAEHRQRRRLRVVHGVLVERRRHEPDLQRVLGRHPATLHGDDPVGTPAGLPAEPGRAHPSTREPVCRSVRSPSSP